MGHRGLEGGNIGGASGRSGNCTGGVFADDGGCTTHGFEGEDLCGVSGSLFLEVLVPSDGRIVGCTVGGEWGAGMCRRCLTQLGAAVVRCACACTVNIALFLVVLCDNFVLVETQYLSVPSSQPSKRMYLKMLERYI